MDRAEIRVFAGEIAYQLTMKADVIDAHQSFAIIVLIKVTVRRGLRRPRYLGVAGATNVEISEYRQSN